VNGVQRTVSNTPLIRYRLTDGNFLSQAPANAARPRIRASVSRDVPVLLPSFRWYSLRLPSAWGQAWVWGIARLSRLGWMILHLVPAWPHLRLWCWSGGSRILTELSLCCSIDYHYNGAQWYKQFLQVGRMFSKRLSSIFMVLHNTYILFFVKFFTLPFGGIGPWSGWLTIVLQCLRNNL